eukprot:CAMPEP_0116131882 /NCGR_PEP_ID=MMETSP0329-20121206/9249_1 /TAXON_ID=697910 /ORGANISM="Pseudo-nitzschia arenysensis, Strain B593" /LENGTH=441 /DNA_ID=CAMNT_0003626355 /DNA_START=297 /DNA_END=1622 /DNA_ORIENTATION=-
MAGSDVNDKLNGLITLLKTVGIDGLDSNALLEQQKRKSSPKKDTSSGDAQILELVKKLQQAQADSPEILEALKSPELLVLASLAAQKQGLQAAPEPPKPAPTSLDDVFDDDDDNYPKIGPGYSDDVSVVSELSTPTVMTRQSVADEEYYSEVRAERGTPPLLSRGLAGHGLRGPTRNAPIRGSAAKSRNMVGQVRPIAPRRSIPAIPPKPSGGAAAQRRLNYQMAMNKLEAEGFGSPKPDKSQPLSPIQSVDSRESKKLSRSVSGTKSIGSNTAGSGSRRKPRSTSGKSRTTDDIDWGITDEDGWPAFEELSKSNSASELFVDSNGFFSENVFANDDHGVTTSKSRRKKGTDASTSSGGKKKSREERSRKHRSKKDRDGALSDDDREGSTRKSHRTKKDKEKDNASDDGTGTSRKSKSKKDKDKDREKSTRRKARRATMQT